jgi:hypothetical protein
VTLAGCASSGAGADRDDHHTRYSAAHTGIFRIRKRKMNAQISPLTRRMVTR